MDDRDIINWLINGDVSIQYQVYRDLLSTDRNDLRNRIENEGWGAVFLSKRNKSGHWGKGFYQPKWTSTHYTLLDLKNLGISPSNAKIQETLDMVIKTEKGKDGGIYPISTAEICDVCVNGMFLNYAAYFSLPGEALESVIDFILQERMSDGGFNCRSNRSGARHSSLHTTLSVLEGIAEYESNSYKYRLAELKETEQTSRTFILQHQLYRSDKTAKIIDSRFLRFPYPARWRYDILRCLDYFRYTMQNFDKRMLPAIEVILKKKRKDNRWLLPAKHPGQTHFEMEKAGEPSRWNTLRALRVLRHFKRAKMP